MDSPDSLPLAAWAALHLAGLAAALISRLDLGARTDVAVQVLTATSFCVITWLAVCSMRAGGDQFRLWVLSAGALVIMVVAAVIESRRETIDPTLARFLRTEE